MTASWVANGYVLEVEDRGLGMPPEVMAEVNAHLAHPPEFDLANSDQLGLFVVSRLAARHGISVEVRQSAFGGTLAIVLLPRHLVVTDEAFRAGLPGEPLVAQLTANGNHEVPATPVGPVGPVGPAGQAGQGSGSGFTDLGGMAGLGQTPGVRISGPLRRSQGSVPERPERSATNGAEQATVRRTVRPAPGRTSCPGGITTSRERRPGRPGHPLSHRPTRARRRSACRRPPSTCLRRGSPRPRVTHRAGRHRARHSLPR